MAVSLFDMAVSQTPPNGYSEPYLLTLGTSWRPNDYRLLCVSGSGSSDEITQMMQMNPDPPTGFVSAYSRNPTKETHGVYYRKLAAGDTGTSVSWRKPPGWQHFVWATLTARGVDPGVAPVAGNLSVSHVSGAATATVSSVSVPAAGVMVFCLGNVPSPEGKWPSWAVSMGVPAGWTHLVATDKSGAIFYPYDTNPSVAVFGKSFASAGSTGAVTVPLAQGAPAFAGLYTFLRPASDVSISVGAA